jgi:hypothetical protein
MAIGCPSKKDQPEKSYFTSKLEHLLKSLVFSFPDMHLLQEFYILLLKETRGMLNAQMLPRPIV